MRFVLFAVLAVTWFHNGLPAQAADELRVGFAEIDITPDVTGPTPVWIAGYGHGRQATGVHDPIMARGTVLENDSERVALVAVDLVGLQYPEVQEIRAALPEFKYVLVASTHNHEGPDVIGIWGSNPFRRGVDETYLKRVVTGCVEVVRRAERDLTPAVAQYGTAEDESLLRDSREPQVKDGVLRVLKFTAPPSGPMRDGLEVQRTDKADSDGLEVRRTEGKVLGLVVQFSCHPESLGSRNTLLTADFPHVTIARLRERYGCSVVYFSGAVGGLMTNPTEPLRDSSGVEHPDGTFEYARLYGEKVAATIGEAVARAEPVRVTPFAIATRRLALPVANQIYRAASEMRVLQRPTIAFQEEEEGTGAKSKTGPTDAGAAAPRMALETEVAYLRLGEVHIAGIPGELYPELVYGRVPEPAEPGADFPAAPVEPSVVDILPGPKWLLIGLANDEVGYIIPRRQWDEQPPFCYGRSRSQYGEINSCGPDVAPRIMNALRQCVHEPAAP